MADAATPRTIWGEDAAPMTGVEWAAVPGYAGYAVTRVGAIRGPSGRVLRPMTAHRGHLYILTRRPGVPRKLYIHKAVLLAFVGPPPRDKPFGRHLNDKLDNRLENLEVTTLGKHTAEHHRIAAVCSVEGCNKPHSARGWCHMHYMRWWNHAS